MIRVAICDDEEIFIKELRKCLNKYIEETGKEISIVEFKDGKLNGYGIIKAITNNEIEEGFLKMINLNMV